MPLHDTVSPSPIPIFSKALANFVQLFCILQSKCKFYFHIPKLHSLDKYLSLFPKNLVVLVEQNLHHFYLRFVS